MQDHNPPKSIAYTSAAIVMFCEAIGAIIAHHFLPYHDGWFMGLIMGAAVGAIIFGWPMFEDNLHGSFAAFGGIHILILFLSGAFWVITNW